MVPFVPPLPQCEPLQWPSLLSEQEPPVSEPEPLPPFGEPEARACRSSRWKSRWSAPCRRRAVGDRLVPATGAWYVSVFAPPPAQETFASIHEPRLLDASDLELDRWSTPWPETMPRMPLSL